MKANLKSNEIGILWMVVIIHSLILYYICDFSKAIETYNDELYYFNLAKCLADGRNFSKHGIRLDFVHIAYPLAICPVFFVKDAILSMHFITMINSVLMSVSIVPVWLLCKELEVGKKIRWFIIFIIMIYPSMTMAATVMTENLYWPLTLFTYYYIVRIIKYRKTFDTFIAGILSFLCYFCKEVGIVIFLSSTVWFFISPVDSYFFENRFSENTKKPFATFYLKSFQWKNLSAYVLTYVVFYIIVNKFFLSTVINGYGGVSGAVSSLAGEINSSKIIYILYAVGVYIVYAMIAFMIAPIIAPMLNLKEMSHVSRKTYFYVLILFMVTILTIICTISVRENFGQIIPRVHMRYFSSMIGLMLPVFGSLNLNKYLEKNYNKAWISLGIFWIFAVFVFKGVVIGSSVDSTELGYAAYLHRKYGIINIGEINIYITGMVYSILGGIIIALGYFVGKSKVKYTYRLFYIVAVLMCILNSWKGFEVIKGSYYVSENYINDMKRINDYFIDNELEGKNVMFLCNRWYDKGPKVFDTYFRGKKAYLMSKDMFTDILKNNSGNQVSDYIFSEPLQGKTFQLNNIDYFITENKGFQNLVGNVEYLNDISSEKFSVFNNLDSSQIYCLDTYIIDFTKGGYSTLTYQADGISTPEKNFSWTDGNELLVSCNLPKEIEQVKVQINITGTFNGVQNYIVYQNDMLVSEGNISSSGQIIVDLTVADGICGFKINFPNAVSPYSLGVSNDKRVLAISISSIEFIVND